MSSAADALESRDRWRRAFGALAVVFIITTTVCGSWWGAEHQTLKHILRFYRDAVTCCVEKSLPETPKGQ